MNSYTSRCALLTVALWVFAAGAPAFGASDTVTYQGVLVDSGGNAVSDGTYEVRFQLFAAPAGGSALWSEIHQNLPVSGGVFSVELGTQSAFQNLFANNAMLFLQIRANLSGGLQTYSPRVVLTAAPYAMSALDSDRLNGQTPAQFLNTVQNQFSGTGADSTVGGGNSNVASGHESTVSGGSENQAGTVWSTVGGGKLNLATGQTAVIAGGQQNEASQAFTTVGGGIANAATGAGATVAGGISNTASGDSSAILGGSQNTASGAASTVGGGGSNESTGDAAFTTGGFCVASNDYAFASGLGCEASGRFSFARGLNCSAEGHSSFAAGNTAKALGSGSFCWADSTGSSLTAFANQFWARASNGFFFRTNSTATTGASLSQGSGTWSSLSDRNVKKNIEPIDSTVVLEKVAEMPISEWSYHAEGDVRHMGPMAQDFHAAFGLGPDDKGITSLDGSGVALAAIQGLVQRVEERDAELNAIKAELARLTSLIESGEGGSQLFDTP